MFILTVTNQQYAHYFSAAYACGLPMGDYLCSALAKHHGMPVPPYIVESLDVVEYPGRAPVRSRATIRIPKDQAETYIAAAAGQGLSLSAYLRMMLAQYHHIYDPGFDYSGLRDLPAQPALVA